MAPDCGSPHNHPNPHQAWVNFHRGRAASPRSTRSLSASGDGIDVAQQPPSESLGVDLLVSGGGRGDAEQRLEQRGPGEL